jgi:glycosyltransferase involved in cell wall biosynthesis
MPANLPKLLSRDRPALSLVFPARDEEANLAPLLDAARRSAGRFTPEFELLVVDDGSRDGSASLVEHLAQDDPRIRLIRHAGPRGYGAALRTGLRAARGELVFFSDADLQFDLHELESLLVPALRFDVVAGYRAPRRDPLSRRLLARIWGAIVRALFELPVRDIDCAFKLFHRRVLEQVPLASLGAFVNTELLVRARSAGFRIHQVPVTHRPRRHGRQSGARPRVILRAVVELASLYRELRRPSAGLRLPEPGRTE